MTPKEQGIKQAIEHANQVHPDWSELAFEKAKLCLISFETRGVQEFQICDLRKAIDMFFTPLPEPSTKRAWGHISRLLRQANLIKVVGYKPTENLTAHNAIAAIYKVI